MFCTSSRSVIGKLYEIFRHLSSFVLHSLEWSSIHTVSITCGKWEQNVPFSVPGKRYLEHVESKRMHSFVNNLKRKGFKLNELQKIFQDIYRSSQPILTVTQKIYVWFLYVNRIYIDVLRALIGISVFSDSSKSYQELYNLIWVSEILTS